MVATLAISIQTIHVPNVETWFLSKNRLVAHTVPIRGTIHSNMTKMDSSNTNF